MATVPFAHSPMRLHGALRLALASLVLARLCGPAKCTSCDTTLAHSVAIGATASSPDPSISSPEYAFDGTISGGYWSQANASSSSGWYYLLQLQGDFTFRGYAWTALDADHFSPKTWEVYCDGARIDSQSGVSSSTGYHVVLYTDCTLSRQNLL